MTPSILRAHAAHAVIHFAPIRRSADEHCGLQDPQTLRFQNNQFVLRWRTNDEDDSIEYAGFRASVEHLWGGLVAHLQEQFDGVAAIQVDLAFDYFIPARVVAASLPQLGDEVAFHVSVRRAAPPVGTFALTVAPAAEREGKVTLHASLLGHPGSSSVADLMGWFDRAYETLEANVAALTKRRQDTPYPWAQEAPSD
jgi:hypothetical protein